MATTTIVSIHRRTQDFHEIIPAVSRVAAQAGIKRRRRVSPESGRALEILGHAIEYLADDYIYEGGQFNLADARIQALLMLVEKNREIYFACPEVPSLAERFRNWLRLSEAM